MITQLIESFTNRRFFWVLSGLLPLLIFAALMLLLFTEQQEKAIRRLLHEAATNAAHVVEQAIVEQIGLLNGLAASRSLDTGDFDAFRLDAQRLSNIHPKWCW